MVVFGVLRFFLGWTFGNIAAFFQRRPIPEPIKDKIAFEVGQHLKHANELMGDGKPDSARSEFGAASAVWRKSRDRLGEAHVLLGLGNLEGELGNHDKACEACFRAAQLYEMDGMSPPPDAMMAKGNSISQSKSDDTSTYCAWPSDLTFGAEKCRHPNLRATQMAAGVASRTRRVSQGEEPPKPVRSPD